MTQRTTRAERLAMPLARSVVRDLAVTHGGCVRPVQLRRTDLQTGQAEPVLVPCGHTLAAVCPSCAERAKTLRAAQCREGWHLDREPIVQADEPDDEQKMWVELRSDVQRDRDQAEAAGQETATDDAVIGDVDEQITRSGIRGNVLPARPVRRQRSTRRRQDTPDLPRRKVAARTIGKTYAAPDGKTFRPSMFVTLTCPGYGRVGSDGTPADPARYDYQRAARDALHFAALFDRFVQNLRRFLGYDVQYFAAVEPQRRLAPHIHIAMRGTLSRTELRQVLAATYHQVWWPPTDQVKHDDASLPVWHEASGHYLDPATGELLPTWDQALDAIGPEDEPLHVARFGERFDAQGVIAGSRDANRCIGYLTKYLTKHVADCHQATHASPARARRPAGRRAAVRAVLADVRELAALRRPAEECAAWPAPWALQGQGAPPRAPRLRRAPGPGLPQVVRQDPRRPPRRPARMAPGHSRNHRGRPGPLHLGARLPRRSRPHAQRPTTAARRRRPPAMARRAHPGPGESQRPGRPGTSGNRAGRMTGRSETVRLTAC